ncbi:MAG: alanine dehydrogenase [Deltaproteobacteria bacterium]|nr:alanine dehydrogenase [Deltaproteobacteria bacterium]
MIVGVPREIKAHEYRVSLLPVGARLLVQAGHRVVVQRGAGVSSGFDDGLYEKAGATLVDEAKDVFERADMIVKVKEPIGKELEMMRRGQVMFTYFHFAADKALTEGCLRSGIAAVAYETLTDANGRLPLLTPMSEVAGRMSVQEGAKYLEKPMMGRGILLGGVTGVEPGNVLILGGGVVGTNAARMAAGLGARVTIMDISLDRLRQLDDVMPANVQGIYSDPDAIAEHAREADLIIGAVLIPGARCPILITREMLKDMKPGAVIVDVGVDQGGCVETIRPTTHDNPTYLVDGIVHYGVANMPGAVGRTSTQALCHSTQPYVLELASSGLDHVLEKKQAFRDALNMRDGRLTNRAVADAHGLHFDG